MGMPTKSCKLDIIPTRLLKQVLYSCIPAIIKIINLSLDKADFSTQRKSAVVHPCIKSFTKGTINNNYRSVSNLSFISKAAENVLFYSSVTIVTHTTLFWNTNLLTDRPLAVKQVC